MAFPGTYNFNYYAGDTYSFIIEPKTSNGSVFDLSGYTATFSIATARNYDSIVLSSTNIEHLAASIDPGNEFLTCTIQPGGGDLLTGTTYYYDVEIDNGTGNVYTLLNGIITVTQDIS